ncbi:MAG TPA: DinB family protein [Gemmatimonadaceae bacterium]
MTSARLLANRIIRTYTGPMWHGPSLSEVLRDVSPEQAVERPIPSAHTIWELVLHIITWVDVPHQRLGGDARKDVGIDEDWPGTPAASADAWRAAIGRVEERHRALAADVRVLSDDALDAKVVGHDYTVREMLHGVVEHGTYHGGQIALLKKLGAR